MTTTDSFKQIEEAPVSSMVQLVNHAIAKHQASMGILALPLNLVHNMSSTSTSTSPSRKLHVQNDRHCWDEMFSQLLQYQTRYGKAQVPLVYPENQELSDWVREQQTLKCNEKDGDHLDDETNSTPVLSRNQMEKLNDVGLEWDTRLDNEAIWELRFEELRQYQRKHGDFMVPARYRNNPQLGHWVMTQRRHYQLLLKEKPCSITLERVRRLETISFPWRIRLIPEQVWQTRYAQLSKYRETYGDCLVPQRFHLNPQLGFWVNTQRRHYKLMKEGKKSCMTQERIQMLEASGFIWTTGHRTKQHIHQEKQIHVIGGRSLRHTPPLIMSRRPSMSQSSSLFPRLDLSTLIQHTAILKANKTMNYPSGKGLFLLSHLCDGSNSNRHTRSSSSEASMDRDIMFSAHLRRKNEWHGSFPPCQKMHAMD